jgi:hypothetical protein
VAFLVEYFSELTCTLKGMTGILGGLYVHHSADRDFIPRGKTTQKSRICESEGQLCWANQTAYTIARPSDSHVCKGRLGGEVAYAEEIACGGTSDVNNLRHLILTSG